MTIHARREPGKVSVIVPTFDRARFIGNALKSIKAQDYSNLEVIIVDDGSTDDTAAVVAGLQREDPRILLLPNSRTKGPSGARNTGLTAASGDYIAFLDSDDVWLDGHLSGGIGILEDHPGVDVLFGNFTVTDYESGEPLFNFFDTKTLFRSLTSVEVGPAARMLGENLFEALVRENFFLLGSSLSRRRTVGETRFEEKVTYAEDRDFAIRLCMEKKARFAFREDPVFIQYRHGSSLTRYDDVEKRQKLVEAHLFLFSKYLATYRLTEPERRLLTGLILELLLGLASLYGEKGELRTMLRATLASCRYGVSWGQPRNLLKLLYLAVC